MTFLNEDSHRHNVSAHPHSNTLWAICVDFGKLIGENCFGENILGGTFWVMCRFRKLYGWKLVRPKLFGWKHFGQCVDFGNFMGGNFMGGTFLGENIFGPCVDFGNFMCGNLGGNFLSENILGHVVIFGNFMCGIFLGGYRFLTLL